MHLFRYQFYFSQKFELDWVLFKLAFLKIIAKKQKNVSVKLFGFLIENYKLTIFED